MANEALGDEKIRRLQSFIDDLISIQALSGTWNAADSGQIISTLLDVLVSVLQLDFVYARFTDSLTGSPVELARLFPSRKLPGATQLHDLGLALNQSIIDASAGVPLVLANPLGDGDVRIVSFPLGHRHEIATLVPGSRRDDFPTQIEALLLRVAANQALVALQEAGQLHERKRSAEELERCVAERIAQLIAANETLRQEAIRLQRAEAETVVARNEFSAELSAMKRLHQLSTGPIANAELHSIFEEILDASIASIGADFGNIQLLNPSSGALEIAALRGLTREFLDHFASVGDDASVSGTAISCGARIIIEDVLVDPAFEPHRAIAASIGFRSVQSTPLFSRVGELLGMLSTYFRQPHRLSDRDLRMIDIYASQAAGLIERKRTEDEQRKLASLVENSSDFIGMASPQGEVLYLNRAGQTLVGMEGDGHVRATRIFDYVMDDDRDVMKNQILPTVAREGAWQGEIRFRNFHTGAPIPMLSKVFLIRESGSQRPIALATISRDITERKQTEEKLRRSEAYLAEGQRLSHTASWAWNVSTGEVYWSAELFRIHGWYPTETKPAYPDVLNYFHPDDRARAQKTFEDAVRERREYELAYRILWRDGTIRYVNNLAHPVFSQSGELVEYVGTTIDTTERVQTEESLRSAHQKLELILSSISDQFFGFSHDWRFTFLNLHAAAQMRRLGKDPTALVGKVLWEEFPLVPNEETLRRVMSERVALTDELYHPPLREWVQHHMYPSPDGGLVTFQRYVTERKRTEEELRKTQEELAHVSRITNMGELAASIAHEVNQPLGAIVNNSHACMRLFSQPGSTEEIRAALRDIVRDANRASAVIDNIRTLTKKSVSESVPLAIADVITDVCGLAHHALLERGIKVHTHVAPASQCVRGDRVQLQQVLLNLVMNAADAMADVDEERKVITIAVVASHLEEKAAVLTTVKDLGGGFHPNDAEKLFEAFYTTKPQGLGMGLRISRSIIDAHRGRLWATPNEGPGASFFCLLPAEDNSA